MSLGGFIKNTILGQGADDYGSVAVPGSAELDLPAGTIRLTYQESKKSGDAGAQRHIDFASPTSLDVTVTPASGGSPLRITPGMGYVTRKSTKRGQSRDTFGSVEVPKAGRYKVTAGPELPDAVEPKVLVGI